MEIQQIQSVEIRGSNPIILYNKDKFSIGISDASPSPYSAEAYLRHHFKQISELENDPDEQPSHQVVEEVKQLLKDAFDLLLRVDKLPKGCVFADDREGIRVQWHSGRKEVSLVVPNNEPSYIYYRDNTTSDVEMAVTPKTLAKILLKQF
jgi:hypothetical protein